MTKLTEPLTGTLVRDLTAKLVVFEDHVPYEAATVGVGRVTPAAYESGSMTDVNGAG